MNRAGNVNVIAARAMRHRAVLQRLPQHLQHIARELRQLIQKQHAVVRQLHLTRPWHRAPADQPRIGDRVMRRAKRPMPHQSRHPLPALPPRCESASSPAPPRNVSGGRIDGNRLASIVLPDPGGPIIKMLWPPAAATSSARFAICWPRTSLKSNGKCWISLSN